MKITKAVILVVMLLNLYTYAFAGNKRFAKESIAIVPSNQSQDQVIDYLTQKLTREAIEEAGVFIKSELKIESGNITKEEVTNVAGSVAQVKVEEKNTYTKNNQQYVKVRVNIKVDTETVKTFLDKIKQDNAYKEEAEALRKRNRELEKQLKTANRQQYEQTLSKEAEYQVQMQKKRSIEYNEMALKAKEEYANIKKYQREEDIKRQKELKNLQRQMECENAEMQKKIAQEKDELKKAELENQALIKQLENQAKIDNLNLSLDYEVSIQQILQESNKLLSSIYTIKNRFLNSLKENENKLLSNYNDAIDKTKNMDFLHKKPVRDQWDKEDDFNNRLNKYNVEKEKFNSQKSNRISELSAKREDSILSNKNLHINSYKNAITPFIEKLSNMQDNKYYYDANHIQAKVLSVTEINPDEGYFILEIKYNEKIYKLPYYFNDIGTEHAKAITQTLNQFIAEPLFSFEIIDGKAEKRLVAFNTRHLGTKRDKTLYLYFFLKRITPQDKIFTFI